MEMSLQLNCKTVFPQRGASLKLTPLSGFFPRHHSSWCKAGWGVSSVSASAGFPRRRQQKKVSISRPKGSSPKGFVPKSPIGTSNKNRSRKNTRVKKGDSLAPIVSEISGDDNKQTLDVNIDDDKEGAVEFTQAPGVVKSNLGEEIGSISTVDEDVDVLKLQEEEISYIGGVGNVQDLVEKTLDYAEIDENVEVTDTNTNGKIIEEAIKETSTAAADRISEEASQQLKLELEEQLRKQEIEKIAEENLSQGTKMLNKTHLKGDWWFCQLHVPREAYKVDFVFFNGQNVYDNNDKKDFCIPVNGGMDALAFEDFLLEEKRKELEKIANEQAERERQAEEQGEWKKTKLQRKRTGHRQGWRLKKGEKHCCNS
ncbi:Immunoglobulin-like fold [Sesbania bispinosa]|nr:Immunoglobulin-like fold [Sesbania bispinosa]